MCRGSSVERDEAVSDVMSPALFLKCTHIKMLSALITS